MDGYMDGPSLPLSVCASMWKEAFVPGDIYIMYGGGGPKESIQGLGCSPARSLGRHPSHGYYICSPLCIIYTESRRKTATTARDAVRYA
mmetsp:Transcript_26035/g.37326  ORF Transcript_26035/g.37326 Transcript_26035/m.37326 type:complete len:89 (-) Transcript_26035:82-348(-)